MKKYNDRIDLMQMSFMVQESFQLGASAPQDNVFLDPTAERALVLTVCEIIQYEFQKWPKKYFWN